MIVKDVLPNPAPDFRPLRIAVIGGRGVPSTYSGVERICEDLFSYFASRGHHVTIYCRPQVLSTPRSEYRGMRLVRTPAPGGKNGETLTHSLTSILHARAFGDQHGKPFDILSLHTIAPHLWTPIGSIMGPRIISHVHGLDHQREKWKGIGSRVIGFAERVMVRATHQTVVVNPALVDYYKNQYHLATELLPNGVHPVPDDFSPDPQVLARYGLSRGNYVVSIGRLVPEKRIQDTIAAFAKIDTDLKLVFVGEGKHSPEYEQQIKSQAANDPRVVFTGQQGGTALETLFRCAKMYISASELEGMPSSVLECMERKLTPILSDIPPHRALFSGIKDYDLTFQPKDVDGIVSRLRHAIDHPAHADRIAEGARAFVRAHYAWSVLAAKTESLYLQVANAPRNRPASLCLHPPLSMNPR